jgi:hypothetical protein
LWEAAFKGWVGAYAVFEGRDYGGAGALDHDAGVFEGEAVHDVL